jgi:hypothetical protein
MVYLEFMKEIIRAVLRDAGPPLTGAVGFCCGSYLVSW